MATLCILLTAACGFDYTCKKIPNFLIALMAAAGVGWRLLCGGPPEALSYGGELLLTVCLLYPLFKIGAVGAGDVKLFGVTAGYLPFGKLFSFLFVSLLVSAVFSVIKMWINGNFRERAEYFLAYVREAAKGSRTLYLKNEKDRASAGICLSGPALAGVLLYLGGVY